MRAVAKGAKASTAATKMVATNDALRRTVLLSWVNIASSSSWSFLDRSALSARKAPQAPEMAMAVLAPIPAPTIRRGLNMPVTYDPMIRPSVTRAPSKPFITRYLLAISLAPDIRRYLRSFEKRTIEFSQPRYPQGKDSMDDAFGTFGRNNT